MEGDAYAYPLPHYIVIVHERPGWTGYLVINRDDGTVLIEAGGKGHSVDYMRGYVDGSGMIYRIKDDEARGHYLGGRGKCPISS